MDLYAVRFSNGLTKVGRSKTVKARIAQHADRLSVAGLSVSELHTVQCLGDAAIAEANVIARCSDAATEQLKSEWFVGLDFAQVKGWVDEACAQSSSEQKAPDLQYVMRLSGFPIPSGGAYICRACSIHFAAVGAGNPFVCASCTASGYRFTIIGHRFNLELNGGSVPLWHGSQNVSDVIDYPNGVMCEELRPAMAWLRIAHPKFAAGKPLVDYLAARAAPDAPSPEPLEAT